MYQPTYHSILKMKERQGLNCKKAEIRIQQALIRGKDYTQFSSWERNYLYNEGRDGCHAVAYNGFCYIVNEYGDCVTLYPLPAWFGKKKLFDGKIRIRNPKKYVDQQNAYFDKEIA